MTIYAGPDIACLREWDTSKALPAEWAEFKQMLVAMGMSVGVRVLGCQIEDLAAGTDIGDGTAANARTIFVAPAALTLSKLSIFSQGTPTGIDDSNTLVISVYRGANLILTKTFNTLTEFPANHAVTDLGTLANATFAAGEDLRVDVVSGATSDPPAFVLQGEFSYA